MAERHAAAKDAGTLVASGIRAELLAAGGATKAELSGKLGVSFPTVSKFIARMEREGEVVPAGLDESSGGRRARRYRYNPEFMLGLAVFLEKTETRYAVYNCAGDAKEQGGTSSFLSDGVERLEAFVERMLARFPKIKALVFGVPGSVSGGRIIHIPGYPAYADLDLQGRLEARFGLPAVVENDMNAAVSGYAGKLTPTDNASFVYLYFGQNGPGAGLYVNGGVVRGSTSFTGEVSFAPLYDDRNFGEAMEGGARSGGGARDAGKVDAVARLVAAFAAMLNPHAVVFHRDEADDRLLADIAARSAVYMPAEHLPQLAASDWEQDYMRGLTRLGIARMIAAPAGTTA